jgi:hypothetical protein
MTLTNAQMVAVVNKGGSVLYAGRIITNVNDLPSDQQIAIDAVADDAVLISANGRTLIDCSGNPDYPASNAGHVFEVSVAGKIGGASGKVVQVGDVITCYTANSPAGTQADVGANWGIEQGNVISTADVPDSTNKRYVTDAELAVLAATSGANTGDSASDPAGTSATSAAKRLGNDAQYVRTTNGAQTLLGGSTVARAIIIHVEVDTTFAAGDGAAPLFSIGETGNATKFKNGLNTGTAGDKLTFANFLSANAALIITATAATGTTSTGAIHVTALALPEA